MNEDCFLDADLAFTHVQTVLDDLDTLPIWISELDDGLYLSPDEPVFSGEYLARTIWTYNEIIEEGKGASTRERSVECKTSISVYDAGLELLLNNTSSENETAIEIEEKSEDAYWFDFMDNKHVYSPSAKPLIASL